MERGYDSYETVQKCYSTATDHANETVERVNNNFWICNTARVPLQICDGTIAVLQIF